MNNLLTSQFGSFTKDTAASTPSLISTYVNSALCAETVALGGNDKDHQDINSKAIVNGIAIGYNAQALTNSSGVGHGVAIGCETSAVNYGVAIGEKATADKSLAIGPDAYAIDNALALGRYAKATGNGAVQLNGDWDDIKKTHKYVNSDAYTLKFYAGSGTGNKTIVDKNGKICADKLSTDAGNSYKPVYFKDGIPTVCGCNLISTSTYEATTNTALTSIGLDLDNGQLTAAGIAVIPMNYAMSDCSTEDNKLLVTKEFVNSSIATNTGTFKGTYLYLSDMYNLSTLVKPKSELSQLLKLNDYAFLVSADSVDPTYDRYKVSDVGYDMTDPNNCKVSALTWLFEYALNNSTFTQSQWNAINSGITKETAVIHESKKAVGKSLKPIYVDTTGEVKEHTWNMISGMASITGTGNAITDIGIDTTNGLLTATRNTTFLTSYNDRKYAFDGGTNCISVTPTVNGKEGITTKVNVTPHIANNITGTGTSGYLAKFDGVSSVTNGPQFGTSTTTYLNNTGSWATPPDTKNTAGSNLQPYGTSKLLIIGASSLTSSTVTYSNTSCYIMNNQLYSNNKVVLTSYTDNKVDQTVKTDNVEYPLLAKDSNKITTTTSGSVFASGVKLNPNTSTITATRFNGTATKINALSGTTNTSMEIVLTAATPTDMKEGILYFVCEAVS